MCLNDVLDTQCKGFKKFKKKPAAAWLLIPVTFHLFSFGLLLFSGRLI